ncbi:photosynthetic complex assembly protein PuhC [Roseobacteraceae bacterium S113]
MSDIQTDTGTSRIRHAPEDLVPQRLMMAVLALILVILAMVTTATLTDRPLEATPPAGEILAQREVLLWGNTAGEARVHTTDGAELAFWAAGDGGFVSTIDRVVRFERDRHGVAQDTPVVIRLRDGPRLSIFDPSTGKETELEAFGKDNIAQFTGLLTQD